MSQLDSIRIKSLSFQIRRLPFVLGLCQGLCLWSSMMEKGCVGYPCCDPALSLLTLLMEEPSGCALLLHAPLFGKRERTGHAGVCNSS